MLGNAARSRCPASLSILPNLGGQFSTLPARNLHPRLLSMYCSLFLGSVREKAPILSCGDPWDREVPSLESVVPLDTGTAYNMLDVIQGKFNCNIYTRKKEI